MTRVETHVITDGNLKSSINTLIKRYQDDGTTVVDIDVVPYTFSITTASGGYKSAYPYCCEYLVIFKLDNSTRK